MIYSRCLTRTMPAATRKSSRYFRGHKFLPPHLQKVITIRAQESWRRRTRERDVTARPQKLGDGAAGGTCATTSPMLTPCSAGSALSGQRANALRTTGAGRQWDSAGPVDRLLRNGGRRGGAARCSVRSRRRRNRSGRRAVTGRVGIPEVRSRSVGPRRGAGLSANSFPQAAL